MKGMSFLRSMCGKERPSISGMFMFAMTSLNRSSCSQIIDSARDATSVVVTERETQYINNFNKIWHLDKFYKSLLARFISLLSQHNINYIYPRFINVIRRLRYSEICKTIHK